MSSSQVAALVLAASAVLGASRARPDDPLLSLLSLVLIYATAGGLTHALFRPRARQR